MRKHLRKHAIFRKGNLLPIIKLHRYIALSALVFILLMTISGAVLHHSHEWQLDKTYVKNAFLLNWYGITLPPQALYRRLDKNHHLAQIGDKFYFDFKLMDTTTQTWIGAARSGNYYLVVFSHSIYLLDQHANLIEKLGHETGLPVPVNAIKCQYAQAQENLIIISRDNGYQADPDFIEWQKIPVGNYQRCISHKADTPVQQRYQQLYLDHKLSVERLLQDIHSGNFFGSLGVWIVDGVAIALALLIISGMFIWLKKTRRL